MTGTQGEWSGADLKEAIKTGGELWLVLKVRQDGALALKRMRMSKKENKFYAYGQVLWKRVTERKPGDLPSPGDLLYYYDHCVTRIQMT